MKATLLLHTRVVHAEAAFAERVLWQLHTPLPGSSHVFTTPEKLIADFQRNIARWSHGNRDA